MATAPLQDATLDELRAALAPLVASNAAFDGWAPAAVTMAAEQLGVDLDVAQAALPTSVDMIDAWFAHVDRGMMEQLSAEQLAAMKIRQRITALVEARLAAVAPQREALRRALAILAMPQNLARAARLGWRSVDLMWRLAGDVATDYNHYTKRATLGAVYGSTVTVFLDDESEGWVDTRAFLSRRIDNIMQFEKAKAKIVGRTSSERRLSLSRFIGRLRYPAV